MNNRPVKRIAVIDYDNCAYTQLMHNPALGSYAANPHPHYLSQPLLDDIKREKLDAFYGCTHRVTGTAFAAVFPDAGYLNVVKCMHGENFHCWNGLTTSITEHLTESLNLPCLAVSTPDDFISTTEDAPSIGCCGIGYRDYLTKFEKELMTMNKDIIAVVNDHSKLIQPNIPDVLYDLYARASFKKQSRDAKGGLSKNDQLRMLMIHARNEFPGHDLEFVFYDDDVNICSHALTMRLYGSSASLEVRQHDAYFGTIEPKGKIVRSSQTKIANLFAQPGDKNVTTSQEVDSKRNEP